MGWTDVDESRWRATWGERKAVIIPASRSPKTARRVRRVHRRGARAAARRRPARFWRYHSRFPGPRARHANSHRAAARRPSSKQSMDVIVIGGGIAGVATAYQLRAAGHRVCVVERHATVAQGATYGHSGVALPTPLDVWFGPTFLREGRAAASGVICKTGFGGQARAFARRLRALQGSEAFAARYALLRPLIESAEQALTEA